MAISMTGYGRGEYEDDKFYIVVEAKSVNNRYLDFSIKAPKKIIYLEEFIKQQVKKYMSRGKMEIFIKLELRENCDVKVNYDGRLARNYLEIFDEIEKELGITNQIRAIDLAKFQDVIRVEENEPDEEELKNALQVALDRACMAMKEMRQLEGEKLKVDILERCETLLNCLGKIEKSAASIEEEYREKLIAKINDVLAHLGQKADEQRIVQEAAIMADKSSITEEIVRFKSHVSQLQSVMNTDTVGRKMDFLLQEMNREINTIGSKSSKMDITYHVVEMKSELEKIREQVQNIE